MGRDKALLPWPPLAASEGLGETFLSATIRILLYHVEEVLVVVGKNEAALTPVIYGSGASLVVNPDPNRGQFSSLRVALHEVLNLGRDAAMITLVDRPPVQMKTIEILETAFADATARRKWGVVPEYQGKHGHPMLVGRELIEAFLRAPETASARDVEHEHQGEIEYVPVDDPLIALNINTPEQYDALSLPNLPGIPPKLMATS